MSLDLVGAAAVHLVDELGNATVHILAIHPLSSPRPHIGRAGAVILQHRRHQQGEVTALGDKPPPDRRSALVAGLQELSPLHPPARFADGRTDGILARLFVRNPDQVLGAHREWAVDGVLAHSVHEIKKAEPCGRG